MARPIVTKCGTLARGQVAMHKHVMSWYIYMRARAQRQIYPRFSYLGNYLTVLALKFGVWFETN